MEYSIVIGQSRYFAVKYNQVTQKNISHNLSLFISEKY